MSHFTKPTSIPPGWYNAMSSVEVVRRVGVIVTFTVKWRVQVSEGVTAETEDAEPFRITLDERGFEFDEKNFRRLCALLNAGEIPGLPILFPRDVVRLSGIKASVEVDASGKVISAQSRGDNRDTKDSDKATKT